MQINRPGAGLVSEPLTSVPLNRPPSWEPVTVTFLPSHGQRGNVRHGDLARHAADVRHVVRLGQSVQGRIDDQHRIAGVDAGTGDRIDDPGGGIASRSPEG